MPGAFIEAVISGVFEVLGEVFIEVVVDAATPDGKKAEADPCDAGPGPT